MAVSQGALLNLVHESMSTDLIRFATENLHNFRKAKQRKVDKGAH
jgi:hypothetical protein